MTKYLIGVVIGWTTMLGVCLTPMVHVKVRMDHGSWGYRVDARLQERLNVKRELSMRE